MFDSPTIGQQTIPLYKDSDEIRRQLQKRLVFIRTQWRERIQPLLWGTSVVELQFLLFSSYSDLALHGLIAYDYEVPGLKISSAWGPSCCSDTLLYDLTGNRAVGELPHSASALHQLTESKGTL